MHISQTLLGALQQGVKALARAHNEGTLPSDDTVQTLIAATGEITKAVHDNPSAQIDFLSSCSGAIAGRLRVQLAGTVEDKEGRKVIQDFKSRIEGSILNMIPAEDANAVCNPFLNLNKALASRNAQKYIGDAYVELMRIINEEPIYDATTGRKFIRRLNEGEFDNILFDKLEQYDSWKAKYL